MAGAEPAKTGDVVGLILAGGLSRRMGGGDKALRSLCGRPILAHVIDRLRPQASRLVLNANGDPRRFAAFGLPVVPDPVAGFLGPLAGILAGLRWAEANAPGASHVVSVAADTPFFPHDLVARLADAVPPDGIALAASREGVHPVFGLWPVALADDLEAWLRGGYPSKVLAWVDRHPRADVPFEAENGLDPFFNVNTPDDLLEAERACVTPGRRGSAAWGPAGVRP